MNIVRISTLSLTLAIVVVTLGFVNSSSAAPKNCEERPRPGCDDPAVYMAELTMGGFIFSPTPVTPNSQGNSFKGGDALTMNRDDVVPPSVPPGDNLAWDLVLGNCTDLLTANGISVPVSSFNVKSGKWKISGGGSDIRLRFFDIDFGKRGVDIDIDLIGVVGSDPVVPVCTTPTSVFTLKKYSITGQAKRGLPGPSCNVQGDLQADSVLEIERTDC